MVESLRAVAGGSPQGGRRSAASPRAGPLILFAGALILALQNGILFAGFLFWLNDMATGFAVGSSSLLLDVPGIVLVGLGILLMARRGAGGGGPPEGPRGGGG